MMGIKIKKLYIKNFKVYKEKIFDFENSSLIVFDGPNGFGKTTFFDAIELVFTGKIRRYEDFKNKLIDNRETRLENPLYHNDGDGSSITLKVQFEFDGTDYFLMRQTAPLVDINNNLDFNNFKLYALEDFDDGPNEDNQKSDNYLSEFLGVNYKDDFEFLNYIEQEDSLYLLKKNERDKQASISYLFNTKEFEEKIKKFEQIQSHLKKFDKSFETEKNELIQKIESIEKDIFKEEQTEYIRLFDNKNYDWDSEKIDFEKTSYESILEEDIGILSKIKKLIQNKEDFFKSLFNKKLNRILNANDELSRLYYYGYFRESEEAISNQKELTVLINGLFEDLDEFTFEKLMDEEYDIPEEITDEFEPNPIIDNYQINLEELKRAYSSSNKASKIYSSILASHKNMQSHLIEFHTNIEENGVCPLCGYAWQSKELLLKEIEKQKEELEVYNENLNSNLHTLKDSFLANEAERLKEILVNLKENFLYKKEYFEDDFFNENLKRRDNEIKHTLNSLNIDYSNLISTNTELEEDGEELNEFIEFLESQKKIYEEDKLKSYYEEIFNSYFDRNEKSVKELSLSAIEKKKAYVSYLFSLYLNISLKENHEKLAKIEEKRFKCENSLDTINGILNSLKKSLKSYNDQLIKDIELLFHIYSGRIVQDFYGGLGLFIVNKKNKIKFVTAPDKTYDAVFSMSNGQLSALVISFTMALNKKYSLSKLLLIDDPVQSMDDMNTAGLVEVLRNDFKDTQIFLSTHEQDMSTYVRYKFRKFNLKTLRHSLSDN